MDEYNALEVHHFQYPSALSQTGWDGEEINWKELDDALDYINKRYEVGYYWEMGRPGLATLIKRAVRKLNKPLLFPILHNQNELNAHSVRSLNNLTHGMKHIALLLQSQVEAINRVEEQIQQQGQELDRRMDERVRNLRTQLEEVVRNLRTHLEERDRNLRTQLEERDKKWRTLLEERDQMWQKRLENQWEAVRAELQEISQRLDSQSAVAAGRAAEVSVQSAGFAARINNLETESEAAQQICSQLTAEHANWKAEFETLSKRHSELEARAGEWKIELNTQKEGLAARFDNLAERLNRQETGLDARIREVGGWIGELRSQTARADAERSSIRELMNSQADGISDRLNRQETEAERQKVLLGELQEQMKEQANGASTRLAGFAAALAKYDAQLSTLKEEITGHVSRVDSLEARVNVFEPQMDKLEARTGEQEAHISTLQEQVNIQSSRVESQETRVTGLEPRIGGLEALTGEQEARVNAVQEQVNAQSSRTDSLETRINGLEPRMDGLEARSGEQEARVNGLQEQANAQSSRTDSLETRINGLEPRMDGLEPRADSLEVRVGGLEPRMDSLEILVKAAGERTETDSQAPQEDGTNRVSTSQSGEDSIISYILSMLGISTRDVTYLDLGANHARLLSNTYFFYQHGARGVLVEANPDLIPELERERARDTILHRCVTEKDDEEVEFFILNGDGLCTANRDWAEHAVSVNPEIKIERTVLVSTITISSILQNYFSAAPTILNIDIEGNELYILKSMDFEKYRPLIVVAETIPYDPHLVTGQKKMELIQFMREMGYLEYAFTGINSIFIDQARLEQRREE